MICRTLQNGPAYCVKIMTFLPENPKPYFFISADEKPPPVMSPNLSNGFYKGTMKILKLQGGENAEYRQNFQGGKLCRKKFLRLRITQKKCMVEGAAASVKGW